jgi:hypothetical protein
MNKQIVKDWKDLTGWLCDNCLSSNIISYQSWMKWIFFVETVIQKIIKSVNGISTAIKRRLYE